MGQGLGFPSVCDPSIKIVLRVHIKRKLFDLQNLCCFPMSLALVGDVHVHLSQLDPTVFLSWVLSSASSARIH